MFDSLLTFAHGVTKMDFKRAFSEQNNVSCKHEQVGKGFTILHFVLCISHLRPGAMDLLFITI